MKRVHEKVRNRETHSLPEAPSPAKPQKSAQIIDLMAVLKQSLEKGAAAAAPSTADGGPGMRPVRRSWEEGNPPRLESRVYG